MITAQDLLQLAHRLAAGTTETEWRSPISRAYYEAFHVARQLMFDLHFNIPRTDDAHKYMYLRLNNCGHAQIVAASSDLNSLRAERNEADYDLRRSFLAGLAPISVRTSELAM